MEAQELIQERLRQRYLELKVKNPKASVRSFARQLKMPAGTISLVLLGKRKVSYKLAIKLSNALSFDPIELSRVEKSFKKSPHSPSGKTASADSPVSAHEKFKPENLRLSADQFQVVKDWHHFAILNLILTDDFQESNEWIAGRLNLKVDQVAASLERMERLGLTVRSKEGRLKRKHLQLRTTDEVQSLSLQYSHYQSLDLAKEALEKLEVSERDFTWLTLPVDFTRLSEMKMKVREFQDQFIKEFGQEKGANEVARMCVQIFPLSNPRAAARGVVSKPTQTKRKV